MSDPISLLFISTGLLALLFAWFRGKALLMFFQQEEYDGPRFIDWIKDKKGFDKRASGLLVFALFLVLIDQNIDVSGLGQASIAITVIGLLSGILISRQTTANNKKPLVMTQRASKIFWLYMVLTAGQLLVVGMIGMMAANGSWLVLDFSWETISSPLQDYDWRLAAWIGLLVIFIQSLPFSLIFANGLLAPFEERVKAGFRNEAIEKLAALSPTIIAITGSFGKTSTKHILSHILSVAKPTLATPGSVNTDMGITRIIREQLTAEHEYFIVEMGAYGPGSIARLCRLTPPHFGMITAVGAAHFERFKSLETTAMTKFELAEATFKNGGPVAVNQNMIPSDLLADRLAKVTGDYHLTGRDLSLSETKMIREGMQLVLDEGGEQHTVLVPLYGRHQADNILLTVMAARMMGLPWSIIRAALRTIPQIKHRVEVSGVQSGPAVINDAYNSNPDGFMYALEVLDVLVQSGGRRILVTPGMVELGEMHDAEHARLGQAAAKHADIVLVVTPDRIPTFLSAVQGAANGSTTVMTFEKQAEAEAWVNQHIKAEDVVLFENNLPDLFETKVAF